MSNTMNVGAGNYYSNLFNSTITGRHAAANDGSGFMSAIEKKSGVNSVKSVQGIGGKDAASKAKKSGNIAESMQKYPQYAKDWQKEINMGQKLQEIYPPSKSRDDMTMDEYKSYIRSVIDKIPEDYSRSTTETSITISDEAWETMKDDPEFEAYVLGGIEDIFTFRNPWMCPPQVKRYEVMQFGVPMESYHGSSWGDMSFGGKDKAEAHFSDLSKGESYHKKANQQELKRLEEKRAYEKSRQKKEQQEKLIEDWIIQKREMTEALNRSFANMTSKSVMPLNLSNAVQAYEEMSVIV